ncbi:MAG: ATP-dependent DNA helicase RecG [Chloroflexota bacterium]|nr:ATP-dependent DNA helicase RecG [Chloroflexota bacterium]
MSQATDILQKILELEEHKGFLDSAVGGGLTAFAERWAAQARARQPLADGLIDAIRDTLLPYTEQGRSSREVRLRRALDLLGRLAAGEAAAPTDEPTPDAPKRKPRKAVPTVSPLSMAVGGTSSARAVADLTPPPPSLRRKGESTVLVPDVPGGDDGAASEMGTGGNGVAATAEHGGNESALAGEHGANGAAAANGARPPIGLTAAQLAPLVIPPLGANPQSAIRNPQSADAARTAHRRAPSLDSPILVVKGVREQTAKLFERLSIFTVRDLLYFFPRRYDDFSALKPISSLVYGKLETVIGTIWQVDVKRTRNNMAMISATVVDDTGSLRVIWFGREWMARQLVEGKQYVFSGKVNEFNGRLGLNGPEFEPYDQEELLHTGRLVPVYALTEGLTKRVVRRIVHTAVMEFSDLVEDALPDAIRVRAGLLPLPNALRQIHFPSEWGLLESARKRLAFDEFFLIQLGMLQRKQRWQHDQPGLAFGDHTPILDSFRSTLPFQLTGAQGRVVGEILGDMAKPLPMARLVQGDVGSGKTVVAAIALLGAIADGAQGALMAPTEILAEQHYRGLTRMFQHFWLPIGDANPKLAEVAARMAAVKAEAEEAARLAQEAALAAQQDALAAAEAAEATDAPAEDGTKPKRRKKATVAVDTRVYTANETVVDAPLQLSPALLALKALLGKMDDAPALNPQAGPPPGYRPINIALLTAGMRKRERDRVYEGLAEGSIDLAIGTHALITERLRYARLGLVVIDEQHRFGVMQREQLRQKAAEIGVLADTLVMTATPIPRSLALTIYGDLDISTIDEMPPGRQIIKTRWVDDSRRQQSYNFIRREITAGRQAFIICPLVEESDKIDAKSAVAEHERLQTEVFPDFKLALLHGRMKASEKEQIMAAFRRKEYDILVSTSVVEVGIDIPNATVMLVEGAERFGLSQLHQFRGRVGRGEHQSYCILMSETDLGTSMERLRVIEENHDGFRLAEEDMRLRGPGEFFGTRQSGAFDLRMARLSDMDTLRLARREAEQVFAEDPTLAAPEYAALRGQLEAFWALANSAPEA